MSSCRLSDDEVSFSFMYKKCIEMLGKLTNSYESIYNTIYGIYMLVTFDRFIATPQVYNIATSESAIS